MMKELIRTRRTVVGSLIVASVLFTSAHRLPAPVQELPENPSPTPGSEPSQTTKPKKPSVKRKSTTVTREAKKSSPVQNIGKSPFAGKWVGTMPEVPWGNVATELTVDATGTTMQWQESGKPKGIAKTEPSGGTLRAHFQVGVAETWSLTPLGNGTTAKVRLQALMNDQTAVFHRVSE